MNDRFHFLHLSGDGFHRLFTAGNLGFKLELKFEMVAHQIFEQTKRPWVGRGPAGFAIQPPPAPATGPKQQPNGEHHAVGAEPISLTPALNEADTEGVLRLCEQARQMKRPDRDRLIAGLYALNFGSCQVEAVEAVESLTYDLIVDGVE